MPDKPGTKGRGDEKGRDSGIHCCEDGLTFVVVRTDESEDFFSCKIRDGESILNLYSNIRRSTETIGSGTD